MGMIQHVRLNAYSIQIEHVWIVCTCIEHVVVY
jgi:hypothetical protein